MDALQVVAGVIGIAIFIFMVFEVVRTPMPTGQKVGWIIFSFFCTIIALVVWLVTGRQRAYGNR